jgi:hypothetical protein
MTQAPSEVMATEKTKLCEERVVSQEREEGGRRT